MKKFLLFDKVVPRWMIMVLDLFIITWSFTTAYFIVHRFEFYNILRGYFFIYTGLYVAISAGVMFSMRIHSGLIRYSNTRDMLRIFAATFISTLVYSIVANFWVVPAFKTDIFSLNLILLVNFSLSSTLLILLRAAAKSIYHYILNYSAEKKTAVVIYGSDNNAILIKQALVNAQSNFSVIGFVDYNTDKINKEISGVMIYNISKLSYIKQKYKVEKLIVVNNHLDEKEKKVALEACLALGIQVLTVPPSDQWIYGKLTLNQLKDLKIEDLLQRKPIKIDTTGISKDIAGKRVLITGAAGSIGSEIVKQVLQYKPELVILCDQAESPLHEIQLEVEEKFPNIATKIFIGDVRSYRRMYKLFSDYYPEVVYHAAAYKHVPMMEENPSVAVKANVLGTKNIADLAMEFGSRKFVMVSTDKAVNPSNVMGASKRIAEIYIQSLRNSNRNISGTAFITTRFGNVLGSNGSVIPRFQSQIQKGGPITVTHPEIIRYFMTIPEAVQLVLEAGTMGSGGEIFTFDMGEPVKIVDLATKMIKLAGLQPDKDIKIVFTGLRPGEKLYEELLNDGESTLPTHNEKINIAKVITYPYQEVTNNIKALLEISDQDDEVAIVNKMKEIVPEFISKNSKYELLDVGVSLESEKDTVLQ
ncbi:polysaccharide biosynthesis protein [Mucilaginibacter ximonensis]|uniref:Polysaccharide biosynthesis protein n=1 Tax=Mucilaginibacter ximonensis TaxID=538021 RepID=A0ABW5YB25_9SPHI